MHTIDIVRLSELISKESNSNYTQLTRSGFFYFTKAAGNITIDFTVYKIDKGSLLTFDRNQLLTNVMDESCEGFVLFFDDNSIDELTFKTFKKNKNSLLKEKQTSEENIYGFLLNLYKEIKNHKANWNIEIVKQQLQILLLKCDRLIKNKRSFTENYFKAFIHFDHLLTYKHKKSRNALDYSEELNISYKHLNEICKKVIGVTAKDYINDYLVLAIKKELVTSATPIKQLTTEFGFDEPTNFVKYFKRYTEKTPREFRILSKNL